MADTLGHRILPNGIKILWDHVASSSVASLGFFYPFGSRDDPAGREGLAHFVEHFVFKGTENFSASSLARKVDSVGGDLNAYTDRSEIGFTCTVPANSWTLALEVLVELCFRPTFPPEEFEKEKSVILSEIQASEEDPEEIAYEAFLARLDPGHAELRPVAGTISSVSSLDYSSVVAWAGSHLRPENLVFCWSGPLEPELVIDCLISRSPSKAPQARVLSYRPIFARPFIESVRSSFQIVQLVLGFHRNEAITWEDSLFLQTFSILWGETMGSRLFQRLREDLGLCYSVASQVWETEASSGLHTFLSVRPENLEKTLSTLHVLLNELSSQPPSTLEWQEAKKSLIGSFVLSSERMENRMQRLFSVWSRWGRLVSVNQILADLERIDLVNLWPTWSRIFSIENSSLFLLGKNSSKILSKEKARWT
ncbi:MAG: insulinase family protein [Spirochaetales bacterium]|nr:insulinase family protein [Spirochaetales bacterium]